MDEQMMRQLLEEQTKTLEEKFKHHTSILVEDVKKQVQVVAEGHIDLVRRLDSIDNRLDNIEAQVQKHEVKLRIAK